MLPALSAFHIGFKRDSGTVDFESSIPSTNYMFNPSFLATSRGYSAQVQVGQSPDTPSVIVHLLRRLLDEKWTHLWIQWS